MRRWQMTEVEGSRSFDVTSDALWAVVADPARLADWVPTMWRAEPAGAEEVHLEGESHGHRYSVDSLLRIDKDHRSLHWGAEGDKGYCGWLQLADLPSGSEVRIHISVPGDGLTSSAEAAVAEIQQGLEETFDRLAGLIRTLPRVPDRMRAPSRLPAGLVTPAAAMPIRRSGRGRAPSSWTRE